MSEFVTKQIVAAQTLVAKLRERAEEGQGMVEYALILAFIAILVIVALLCAAGLYAAWQLPIAVFPQTDFPRIVIIVDNGEAPASQTLASVTRPIEEAMNGVPGIARIKSKTARGSSEISLYFDWRGNILQELQLVQARL